MVEYTDSSGASQEIKSQSSQELKTNIVNESENVKKRSRNPQNWIANQRKQARQNGQSYINSKGKVIEKKNIKNQICNCKYKCNLNISKEEREIVFQNYYKLDANGKKHYLLNCTKMVVAARQTKKAEKKKIFSFQYFLLVERKQIRVCQDMFLNTLSISKNSVYYLHKNKNYGNTPAQSQWGKHQKKVISEEIRQNVKDHINSFPRVESHYCRANTSKEYLESNLNLSQMYRLYEEWCSKNNTTKCTKSFYEHIFNTEFNIGFHKPKSDVCEKCTQLKAFEEGKHQLSQEEVEIFKKHCNEKKYTKLERDRDRNQAEDPTVGVICFDLENVISLPKSNVGLVFYKRKFSVYNMTAQAAYTDVNSRKKKKTYCCLWDENTGGRTGNDMASAVIKIMQWVIEDFPWLTILITWSDSCIPQNKNSIMSFAMGHFLAANVNIKKIIMKFSTAGHSAVQEIDSVHSALEKLLKYDIIYSPVNLIPKIQNWSEKKGNRLIQVSCLNETINYFIKSISNIS